MKSFIELKENKDKVECYFCGYLAKDYLKHYMECETRQKLLEDWLEKNPLNL